MKFRSALFAATALFMWATCSMASIVPVGTSYDFPIQGSTSGLVLG